MKAILTGHIEHPDGTKKVHLIMEVGGKKLVEQVLTDKYLNVYTQKEIDAFRGRISSALSLANRLTTGNVSHIKANLIQILMGGLK